MELDNNKRKLIKVGIASLAVTTTGFIVKDVLKSKDSRHEMTAMVNASSASNIPRADSLINKVKKSVEAEVAPKEVQIIETGLDVNNDLSIKDSLDKVKHFNQTFTDDIFLSDKKVTTFQLALKRILRVQHYIGYANFNLISFDDMLLYAHRYPKIGKFTKAELALIDELFFFDANKYGFYGNKVITNLTSKINKKDTIKISGSGHYLFQGDALKMYHQVKNDVGPNLVLTSGVRSIVKQLQLFLAKLESSNGNLSLASRSLAPPGHSYHGIGDFDVGKRGFGTLNFTSEFSTTPEYKKLIELKYIDLRYTLDNQVGVRYEPWHIKVV